MKKYIKYTHDSAGISCDWGSLKGDLPVGYFKIEGDRIPSNEVRTSYNLFNLEFAQGIIKEKVNKEKNTIQYGGFKVDEVHFDSDLVSSVRYSGFREILRDNPDYVVEKWKASDGVKVVMDSVLSGKVAIAEIELLTNIFDWYDLKKIEIDEAKTQEELDLINVEYS